MNTIVITVDKVDYGVGTADRRITFVGCTWHIDQIGILHVVREGKRGNCAAFPPGQWSAVIEGGFLAAEGDRLQFDGALG